MLIEPMLVPLAIGAVGVAVLWTLQRVVPVDAPDWVRPPAWLLPFWIVGIVLAAVLGGTFWPV